MKLNNNIKDLKIRTITSYQMLEEMNNSDNLYYIPESRFKKFESKFKRMLKVANKAELVAPTYNVIEKIQDTKVYDTNQNKISYHDFNIISVNCPEIIKLPGGWILIGIIDHKNDGFIRSVPGQEIPKKYRDSDNYCDHCKTNRYRTETFVIQNKNSEYMKVGRQCIQKFLGIDGLALAKTYTGFLIQIDSYKDEDFLFSFGSTDYGYGLKCFLSVTSSVIRNYGWMSKSKAYEQNKAATADVVEGYINGIFDKDEIEKLTPIKHDQNIADKTINYIKNIEGISDYEFNLKKIVDTNNVPTRYAGYAASMISYYNREMEKKNNTKKESNVSDYIGEIKARQVFENLEVISANYIESDWGTTTLLKFKDDNENIIIWFASGCPGYDKNGDGFTHYYADAIGSKFNFKATVKNHQEYNGIKQTMITRASLIK